MSVSVTEKAAGLFSFAGIISTWSLGLFVAPTDATQGEAYRIVYLHLPCAISAFLAAFIMAGLAIWCLWRPSEKGLFLQRAAAEVGLMFTCLTLATGSIWGRPIWGTWWTWDARLTTTLLLAILYFGFIMLMSTMSPGRGRIKAGSVLSLLIAVDVPIIYKSVSWWRTLHQPPSLLRTGGSTMDPDMRQILLISVAAMIIHAAFLIGARYRNLSLAEEVEGKSQLQMQGG